MNPDNPGPVYDRDRNQPVTRPDLRELEEGGRPSAGTGSAGGSSFNFNPGGDKSSRGSGTSSGNDDGFKVSGDGDGARSGSTGTTGAASSLMSKELAASAGVAGVAATAASNAKNLFLGSKRRKQATIGGGITATLVGGSIFAFVILSGPGQLVQLSQMFQKNFGGINTSSSIRANKLLGSAGAQDIGETRVGVIQRQYLRSAITNLSEVGIDLNANSTGGFKSADIDTNKLANKYSDLHGMSTDDQKAWLAEELNIDPEKIAITGDNTFHIDGVDMSTSNIRSFLGSSTDLAIDGGVLGAVNKRTLITYFNVPSLFHPFSRALEAKLRNTTNLAEKQKELEEDRQQTDLEPTETVADDAVSDVNSEASTYDSAAANALLYTGGVCFVRSTANDVIKINRYRILLPAAITAMQFVAIGSQIQSGQDVSADEVGAATASLTDSNGQSVWQGQALQAMEGNENPSGPDISSNYKQAFSPSTTAASIENAADKSLGGSGLSSAACSTVGQLAQVALSIFQGLGSAFAEAASDGAATPLIVGSYAARFGEDAAVQLVAMHFLQGFVLNSTTEGKLASDAFSGPAGGNLLAYGAREAANIGSIAEGAVPLSNSNSVAMANEQQQQDNEQFRSESFAARMFNIDDSRSLAGKLADSVRPSFGQNVTDAVTGFGSLGSSLLSNLSSVFTPKSHADPSGYDWGFPVAAIPQQLMNDPTYANIPDYQNKAAALFNSSAGQQYIGDGSESGSDGGKSLVCFGNKVYKDSSGVWDITHVDNPDTSDPTYTSAGCGNLDDPNWNMTIMFNFDTWTADGMACTGWDDAQACQAIGMSMATSTTPASTTTSTPSGQTPSGDAQQLAQQILQLAKDGKISFAIVNPANSSDDSTAEDNIKDTAAGKPAQTSSSCLGGGVLPPNKTTPLDPKLLQFIVELAGQEKFTINELAGGCHDESNSNHYNGTAVDFGCPFDPGPADSVGQKYGISDGTGETCSTAGHYHYSIGGN